MTIADYVPLVIKGTPPWVWAVLVLLIVLGVRRLKPRRTHLGVTVIAPVAFMLWSLTGVAAAMRLGDGGLVIGIWAAALALGMLSAFIFKRRRPAYLGGGVFLFAASAVPLLIYMIVFWTRYGLGVWAAFEPALSFRLTLAAVAISAATAGRFAADFAPLFREVLNVPKCARA